MQTESKNIVSHEQASPRTSARVCMHWLIGRRLLPQVHPHISSEITTDNPHATTTEQLKACLIPANNKFRAVSKHCRNYEMNSAVQVTHPTNGDQASVHTVVERLELSLWQMNRITASLKIPKQGTIPATLRRRSYFRRSASAISTNNLLTILTQYLAVFRDSVTNVNQLLTGFQEGCAEEEKIKMYGELIHYCADIKVQIKAAEFLSQNFLKL